MAVRVVEKKGKSVDEAIKNAVDELQCNIDDVVIEVIEESAKGILGLGKKPALVRVTLKEKPEEEARRILEEILNKMQINYQIKQVDVMPGKVRINILGKDMGLLIGRKGETLNAVQYIVELIMNRKREEKVRIFLDVEDYRKKKEESLEALAVRLSDKVKKTRKNIVLRPMSSQERRIVHTILQSDPQITTYSTGDEPNRKVVISLKK